MTSARVSRVGVEALVQDPDPETRVSRVALEALVQDVPFDPDPGGGGNRIGGTGAIRRSPTAHR